MNSLRCFAEGCLERLEKQRHFGGRDSKTTNTRRDGIVMDDERTFKNLLEKDDQHLASPSYFRFQCDLKPYMRKMVVTWMLEVCEDQRSEDESFWLAVNYLDRILSVLPVKKNQLQLVAATCLFIASKFNASSTSFAASHLVMYTDFSITIDELLEWELVVLQALKWDLATATPYDFLYQFVVRLPLTKDQIQSVQRHAATLIALSTTDVKFVVYPVSMLASGCLCAAVKGLLGCGWLTESGLYQRLHQLTSVDTDCLVACQEQIEEVLRSSLSDAAAASSLAIQQEDTPTGSVDQEANKPPSNDPTAATTPTDVREITVNTGGEGGGGGGTAGLQ